MPLCAPCRCASGWRPGACRTHCSNAGKARGQGLHSCARHRRPTVRASFSHLRCTCMGKGNKSFFALEAATLPCLEYVGCAQGLSPHPNLQHNFTASITLIYTKHLPRSTTQPAHRSHYLPPCARLSGWRLRIPAKAHGCLPCVCLPNRRACQTGIRAKGRCPLLMLETAMETATFEPLPVGDYHGDSHVWTPYCWSPLFPLSPCHPSWSRRPAFAVAPRHTCYPLSSWVLRARCP